MHVRQIAQLWLSFVSNVVVARYIIICRNKTEEPTYRQNVGLNIFFYGSVDIFKPVSA